MGRGGRLRAGNGWGGEDGAEDKAEGGDGSDEDGTNFMTLISPEEWGKNDFQYID